MNRVHDRLQREIEEMRRVRDELHLQAYLGRKEARELWDDLAARFGQLESRVRHLTHDSEEVLEDVGGAIARTLGELREGYERLRAERQGESSTVGLPRC